MVVLLALLASKGGAKGVDVPPDVVRTIEDMVANRATDAQMRAAAESARRAGFTQTSAMIAQTALAQAELHNARAVPQSVAQAASSGLAGADELRQASEAARTAKLPATAAMLGDRAAFLDTGTYPTELAEKRQVVAAVTDARKGKATVSQMMTAASTADRQGLPQTSAALSKLAVARAALAQARARAAKP